jgi:hypothetical protein
MLRRRAKWIGGLAALALAASGGVALAGGVAFTSVTLTLPSRQVPVGASYSIGVHGYAAQQLTLDVFLTAQACKGNAEAEANLPSGRYGTERTIHQTVAGTFQGNAASPNIRPRGINHACAYLYTMPRQTIASDDASWEVTPYTFLEIVGPIYVPQGHPHSVRVRGRAATNLTLDLFLSNQACRATAEAEANLGQGPFHARAIHETVAGYFDRSTPTAVVDLPKGRYYTCAYLYERPTRTVERAEAEWILHG